MEYTVQNLEYAVSVFYNGEQTERANAHAWLTTAQRVPEAWNFVWDLLQPTKGTEVQFYASTTLHTKILRCWNEVPPESYEELGNKLLQAVFTYSNGPKIVTNRLCISLAAFILQQGTVDLATILRPLSNVENTSLLLEVLTVIPEEFNSMTMALELRTKNRIALQQACPAVLDDMLRYLQTVYNDFQEQPSADLIQTWTTAASCACSWLTLDGEDAADNVVLADRMPLCRALLTVVHVLYTWNDAVSDSSLEACEASLAALREAGGARHRHTALQLLADLAALTAPIMRKDDVPNSINEELLLALITCCVALGETHAKALVEVTETNDASENACGARQLLDILLAAQAAPGHYPVHETRSNLVFGFWYTLQDEVLHIIDDTKVIHPVWKEVFSRLLLALVTKSEAAPENNLSKDDLELLRCYRQDIADTVMYCFAILGDWCWSTVESAFNSAETDSRREAALHIFLSLADAAPYERAPDALFNMLEHAVNIANTSTDNRMLNTALDCLGGYASWLSSVSGQERCAALGLSSVMAAGAALQRCVAPAALALRKLCADCSAPAADLAPDIVHAARSTGGRSDGWVRRQLCGAAGAALAAAPPLLAAPLLEDLARTLRDDIAMQRRDVNLTCCAAECAAVVMAALAPSPALAAQLFRIIAPTLPPLAQHEALVEYLFTILKQTVSALMEECVPLVAEIAELLMTGFTNFSCAPGLDIVKLMVLVVGEWSGSAALVSSVVATSVQELAPQPAARPDLSDGLFAMLMALTKKKPEVLNWIEHLLPELVDLGGNSIRVWAPGAVRSVCGWLSALCVARPRAAHARGAALTHALLICIGGVMPRNQVMPVSDLLLSMNRADWGEEEEKLETWLRTSLAPSDFPTPHATHAHKQKFIAGVLRERTSKRRILEVVQEFSLACRGLIGTEYSRQAIASRSLVS
ncbi:importin-13 [Bombyx mori]|uniref:Importin N-terminal domain-containing protein n=1 Tax=Bombyx mori TaxID=7091 RepID=A0A8R2AMI5_BOMMO|nr:importin-13 [Bombyx mori]